MLAFEVKHQSIFRTDRFRPVEKSVNYLYAAFSFLSEDWAGAEKKAICQNEKTGYKYDAKIEEDRCLIPWETLADAGAFKLCVEGRAGEVKFSTKAISVALDCTLDGGAETNPPSLTEFEQLKKDVAELKENGTGGSGSIYVDEEGYLTTTSGGFTVDEDGYILL